MNSRSVPRSLPSRRNHETHKPVAGTHFLKFPGYPSSNNPLLTPSPGPLRRLAAAVLNAMAMLVKTALLQQPLALAFATVIVGAIAFTALVAVAMMRMSQPNSK